MVQQEFVYKVIVIGNPRVGKTQLLNQYVNCAFSENYKSTLQVDFLLKVKKQEGRTLRIQFWDIMGQEHTKNLARNFYTGTSACIIVFDITNQRSFEAVREWKEELDKKLEDVPVFILANKSDLVDDPSSKFRPVLDDMDIELFKEEVAAKEVWMVSAKTGFNLERCMASLDATLLNENPPDTNEESDTIQLVPTGPSPAVAKDGSSCSC